MSVVRGWCPTAWRPMAAGDGLLLRIRPPLARLSVAQMRVLADVSAGYGNGAIDATNRGGLQVRGLSETGWRAALDRLVAAGLVDPDPAVEAHTLMVAPNWVAGDDTHRIASALMKARADSPVLPGKIGCAIDAGVACVLTDSPGDFRIERGVDGGLILRADGCATGASVRPGEEVAALMALADWFVASGGVVAGRMARHDAPLPDWARGTIAPVKAPRDGAMIDLPFGRLNASPAGAKRGDEPTLTDLARLPGCNGVRVTPWRALIVEGAPRARRSPLRHVDACVGAPACPQATVETRPLAASLAPHIAGRLHISGCAKGCARAAPAAVVVTGRDGRFDLAFDARAGDPPAATALTADQLIARFGTPDLVS